jgi:pyrroloquinoline-quinone synthase
VPAVRRAWLQRIVDHDGAREDEGGIERWIQLGVALGVPRDEMDSERHVLPAVRMAAESYVTFCKTRSWVEAVASSLTELFAPDIMRRRLESLPVHYPWIRPEAYAYFESRLVQAPRDSAQALAIVRAECTTAETQQRAFDALQFKMEMLWVMIDAIHNAYRE